MSADFGLGAALEMLPRVQVSHLRSTGAYDASGNWVVGAEVTLVTLPMNVQPAPAKILQRVAEGERIEKPKLVHSTRELDLSSEPRRSRPRLIGLKPRSRTQPGNFGAFVNATLARREYRSLRLVPAIC